MMDELIAGTNPEKKPDLKPTRLTYEIFEAGLDPVNQWELVGKNVDGNEQCCIRFRTYGEAWREAERRKQAERGRQADLLSWSAQQENEDRHERL
jgi:hypothetical protein